MYKKLVVTITFLFLFIQSANSNENNFEIYKSKFNKIIKFIQKEKNDIKKYQKNEWIKVKNFGLGKVLKFSKTWNVVFSDSPHLVDFVNHGQRLVVLRRRKFMK